MARYELRCRECGKTWGNQPRSICDDCFSPLEVSYDYDAVRTSFTRERISQRPPDMWRYAELLPLPEDFHPSLATGFTPLFSAPRLAQRLGAKQLWIKNDAVCLPTLSFKDRVVAVALAQARNFGFETVACSSTGNLANAVAAQAAREGFQAWIFIPADLEPAKILATRVYGARLVTTIPSSATLRLNQPNPITDATTGLVDAGNWAVSASWSVPATATSGLYIAQPVREDNGGASNMYFVVRDDDGWQSLIPRCLLRSFSSCREAYHR